MKEVIYSIFFKLAKSIFYLIDFILDFFSIFLGFGGLESDKDVLVSLLESSQISIAFFKIGLVGIVVLTVFSILAILKAQSKLSFQTKDALVSSLKSFVSIWAIPFFVFAIIYGVNAIFKGLFLSVDSSNISGNVSSHLGARLFTIAAKDAYILSDDTQVFVENLFINNDLNYMNVAVVSTYYDICEINYLIAIGGGLIVLFCLSLAAINVIRRIFEVLFLYLISPIIAATLPLDDGGKFKAWREMTIGKIITPFAVVLSANVFLIALPYLTGLDLAISNFKKGLVDFFVILAGAFSIVKTSNVINQLINTPSQSLSSFLSEIRFAKNIAFTAIEQPVHLLQAARMKIDVMKNAEIEKMLGINPRHIKMQQLAGNRGLFQNVEMITNALFDNKEGE